MSDARRIFFSSAAVFAATLVDNIVFFAISIIIARYLSLDEFGAYSAALGYATFFSTFTDVGINSTLQRMVMKDPLRERAHFGSAIIIKSALALIIYCVLAATLLFTGYSRSLVLLTLIMGLFRVGNEYHMTFYALFDVRQRFILSAAVKTSFGLLFLAATAGVVFFKGNSFGFAWVRLAAVAVYIIILAAIGVKMLPPQYSRSALREFLVHTIPFGAAVIFSNIFQRLSIVLLPVIHGSVFAGIFSNGYIFFTTLFIVPANIVRVLLPYLYRIDPDNSRGTLQYAFDICSKYLLIAGFYACITAVLFSHRLVTLVFGAKYASSAPVLAIAALGIPFVFTVTPAIITALDRQKAYMRIQEAALAFNIPANILLILFFRSEGAAAASTLTFAFIQIASVIYLSSNKFVSAGRYVMRFFQTAAAAACALSAGKLLMPRGEVIAFAAESAVFFIAAAAMMLRQEDIRLLKSVTGRKA